MFYLANLSSFSIVLCTFSVAFGSELRDVQTNLLPDRDVCGMQSENRIIGGRKTAIGDFAWMALLGIKSPTGEFGFICAGSLISSRYVVTAAHCIKDELSSVILGEHDINKNKDCEYEGVPDFEYCSDEPRIIEIEEKIVYEGYNNNSRIGDIALLRLKEEVNYTDFIKPICLPLSQELRNKDLKNETLLATGWGTTEKGWASNIKLKVELPVVLRSYCSEVIKKYLNLTIVDSQICAGGGKGKDSCQGDSGGPLMYYDRQINAANYILCGVVSYGYKCGVENAPGVYTKVADYIEWIVKNLKP